MGSARRFLSSLLSLFCAMATLSHPPSSCPAPSLLPAGRPLSRGLLSHLLSLTQSPVECPASAPLKIPEIGIQYCYSSPIVLESRRGTELFVYRTRCTYITYYSNTENSLAPRAPRVGAERLQRHTMAAPLAPYVDGRWTCALLRTALRRMRPCPV
jgi:hypothetical protein